VSTCVERIGFSSTYVPWFTSIRPGRRAPLSLVVVVARIDPTSYLPTSHHPSSRRPPRSRLSLSFFPSRLSASISLLLFLPPLPRFDVNSSTCSTYHLESGRSFARPVDSADFFFFSIDGTSRDEHFSGYAPQYNCVRVLVFDIYWTARLIEYIQSRNMNKSIVLYVAPC